MNIRSGQCVSHNLVCITKQCVLQDNAILSIIFKEYEERVLSKPRVEYHYWISQVLYGRINKLAPDAEMGHSTEIFSLYYVFHLV
jgi:hypothetical protein